MSVKYQLSSLLNGTGLPRCGALADASTLLIGDQSGTITQFHCSKPGGSDFQPGAVAPSVHEGIVFTVAPVPVGHPVFPEGSVISGGGDREVAVSLSDGTVLARLSGHSGAVGSIEFTADGTVVTGGWDGCIKTWRGNELQSSDKPHVYATTLCLIPGTDVLVSGSGSKELHFDRLLPASEYTPASASSASASASSSASSGEPSGRLERLATVEQAHGHLIRRLIPHPLGVLSAGNDGWVKLWARDGSALARFQAFVPGPDQPEFIYDIAFIPSLNLIAAAGDDKTIAFFRLNADGAGASRVATVALPQPARALVALGNGDVVAIGAGGVIILTADPARAAGEEEQRAFEALFKPKGANAIDVASLPGLDVLLQPPAPKEPRTVIVNDQGRPMVFLWSDDAMEWELQGEAIGTKSKDESAPQKKLYQGVEYDCLVPVDIDPSLPPLQLPFNKDDDPDEIAASFITRHGLPVDYHSEIVAFITPLVDQDAVRARSERVAAAAAAVQLLQTPTWRSAGFAGVSTCNAALMRDALLRRSGELAASADASARSLALTAEEQATLTGVVLRCAEHATRIEAPVFTAAARAVVAKLLRWPAAQITPCLDLFRVLMAHKGANAVLVNPMVTDDAFIGVSKLLYDHVSTAAQPGAVVGNVVLCLQAMGNWIVYRSPAPGESPSSPTAAAPEPVAIFYNFISELAAGALAPAAPARFRAEAVRVLFNLTVALGRLRGMATSPLLMKTFADLLAAVPAAIAAGTLPGAEAQYQAVATLVSIAQVAPALANIKPVIALATKSSGGDPALAQARAMAADVAAKMSALRAVCAKSDSAAVRDLAHDIKVVFGDI